MFEQIADAQRLAGRRALLKPLEDHAAAIDPLLQACREGETSAFGELYRAHGGRMKSVALNLLGTTQDAEDAVQEAFLKLYRSLAGFKGEARLSTWLYRILVNTCHDMGRKRRRRPAVPETAAAEFAAPIEDHPLRLTVEAALARLPQLQRSVFVLCEVEGFTHKEVGEVLGIAEGTSKYTLYVAKRELQKTVLESRRLGRAR